MNYILFDDIAIRYNLLPLTYLRPISGIRIGVYTIKEKWEHVLGTCSHLTENYLSKKYPTIIEEDNICINGAICPSEEFNRLVSEIEPGKGIKSGETLLAFRGNRQQVESFMKDGFLGELSDVSIDCLVVDKTWKIFQNNGAQLRQDIGWITSRKSFQSVSDTNTSVYGADNIFIGNNVSIKSSVIDAEDGPVYLADNTVLHPGTIIKGPFALLEGSEINMGGRMRGDITIGPKCKVGGEVSNSIFFGYSNKAHDGFVGNSIIAEWCNLGADTNTSNMKNDYSDVKIWNYSTGRFESSRSTFCGLVMGDHSKSGINVMFNSGTSVGVSSSIYNANYPRNFIPSFVKGGASGWSTMRMEEAIRIAERVVARRSVEFGDDDRLLFEKVFELSSSYRRS